MDTAVEVADQLFDAESVGDSEDIDLVPIQSGEDWVAQLDDDLSGLATRTGEAFLSVPTTRGYHVHHTAGMDTG